MTKTTMRIQHKPGDAIQVDWAGDTLPVYDPATGEVRTAFLNYVTANTDIAAAEAIDAQHIPAEIYAVCPVDLHSARAETLRQFIPDSNFKLVCTGNYKPTFPDTVVTRTILDYFKRQRWISSYSILDNGRIRA